MALRKKIKRHDGVTTNYHRIQSLTQTVNRQNSIVVISYVDEESRENEKNSEIGVFQPYQQATTYEVEYDPTMTIEKAYKHIKSLPDFEEADDI